MTDIERRRILQALGVAGIGSSMMGVATGNVEDSTPYCPDCPDGTDLLAKYEWDTETKEWVFDDAGACDVVDFTVLSRNDDDDPIAVEWDSSLFYDGLRVKQGDGVCTSFTREETRTDSNEKDGTYEGEVTDLEDSTAISYIAFCSAVCFQADLVFGDPIENLGSDDGGFYSKRKLVHIWGNSYTQQINRTKVPHTETHDGCTVTLDDVSVDFDSNELSVSFTVDEGSCDLSLVSYIAPCPIGFTKATGDLQYLFDSVTADSVTSGMTWTVQLPVSSDLSTFCQDGESVV